MIAEKSFPTSGAAVQWLKDQALRHFPRARFPVQIPDRAAHAPILDDLCASHIAGSISWVWDGGFYATLGEPKLAEKWSAARAGEALDWLRDQAIRHYPDSEFAARHLGFGSPCPATRVRLRQSFGRTGAGARSRPSGDDRLRAISGLPAEACFPAAAVTA